MAEQTICIDVFFGHVHINSWFEPQPDGSMVGMGSATHYDGNGVAYKTVIEPTGLVMRWT